MNRAIFLVTALWGPVATAGEIRTYSIAIGSNQAPDPSDEGADPPAPLRYADDDAASFHDLTRNLPGQSALLTILDTDSQARFPALVAGARPPSLAELERVVTAFRKQMEEDRAAGREPVLLFFYSGHGTLGRDVAPGLTLLDGPLTQIRLYDDVLARLPAQLAHVFVDACHAEAVVRPRDADLTSVKLSEDDVRRYAARSTLERFPHVGAIVAAATSAEAHEWDEYQRGVFTYELLSALRGGADVNRDNRIEYSEVLAFLAAANREVSDPRARLAIVGRPPKLNQRAPIVDLALLTGTARVGVTARAGVLHVEDGRGNRLCGVRAEPGFEVHLAVPAGETLYVRTRAGDAEVRFVAGESTGAGGLRFVPPRIARRGALESSLRRGLFGAPFGPLYYTGFVDHSDELGSVPLLVASQDPERRDEKRPVPRSAFVAWGVAGSLAAGAGVFGGFALVARDEFHATDVERQAFDASDRYDRHRFAAVGCLTAALIAGGVGFWLWRREMTDDP